jgi:hypothetical protein
VTREIDRDEICYFNLRELVREFGYTSIDYLYYKKRDGLVAIELDTDVMAMLKEHETEKEVSLFVTKQRIATLAPSKSKKAPANRHQIILKVVRQILICYLVMPIMES